MSDRATPMTSRSADGTTIAVEVSGDGPPVVLVSGAATTRMTNAALAAHLSEHFTVHNFDRRGRGDSEDTLPYAVEREYEDLHSVVELAGGEAAVFGSSSGGILAAAAVAHGVATTRLALWEPPFIVPGTRDFPADYAQQVDQLLATGRHGDVIALFMTGAVGLPADMVAGMRQAPFWASMEALAPTIAYDAAITDSGVIPTSTLARVAVPTLVLDGGVTPWMTTGADAAAHVIPNARRRTLSGQTHDFDPAVLAPALTAFFDTDATS